MNLGARKCNGNLSISFVFLWFYKGFGNCGSLARLGHPGPWPGLGIALAAASACPGPWAVINPRNPEMATKKMVRPPPLTFCPLCKGGGAPFIFGPQGGT